MTRKIIYLLFAVSIGFNVGLIATPLLQQTAEPDQGPPTGPGGGMRPNPGPPPGPRNLVDNHLEGMTRHLGLNQDQQDAVRAIMERHAPRLRELQMDATKSGRLLTEAYSAPEFDPARFQKLAADANAARARLDSLSAIMLVEEAAVLTPEQRREFAKVAPSIHSNTQGRPGRDGPPPRRDGPPPRERQ
jgi:Spy/CpxP family protein refolding chaperone